MLVWQCCHRRGNSGLCFDISAQRVAWGILRLGQCNRKYSWSSTSRLHILPSSSLKEVLGEEYLPSSYDVYGIGLVCKHPITILTHHQGVIEVCSGIDCCSWCNGSCHNLCDSKLKRGVRVHPTLITNDKRPINLKGWNLPPMCRRLNCTCECHSLLWTHSLHIGLQLST